MDALAPRASRALEGVDVTATINQLRLDRIREIISEHLELDLDDMADDSHFVDDHGADSLALIDVLAALEKEFSIEIDQNQFARMVDVRSVCAVVAESAGW
jgi:acyl carrier protein